MHGITTTCKVDRARPSSTRAGKCASSVPVSLEGVLRLCDVCRTSGAGGPARRAIRGTEGVPRRGSRTEVRDTSREGGLIHFLGNAFHTQPAATTTHADATWPRKTGSDGLVAAFDNPVAQVLLLHRDEFVEQGRRLRFARRTLAGNTRRGVVDRHRSAAH